MRIIKEKNKNINENKFIGTDKPEAEDKSLSIINEPKKDQKIESEK